MLVAEVMGQDPNKAVFWFILILISVFDPLAVALTLAVNIALRIRKEEKEEALRLAKEEQERKERAELPDLTNTNKASLDAYIKKIAKAQQSE